MHKSCISLGEIRWRSRLDEDVYQKDEVSDDNFDDNVSRCRHSDRESTNPRILDSRIKKSVQISTRDKLASSFGFAK